MNKKTPIRCDYCGETFIPAVPGRKYCCVSCGLRQRGALRYPTRLKECLEHIKECKTQRELKRRYPRDYRFCIYHHIPQLTQIPLGKTRHKRYTNEEVEKAARKYTTKSDFYKGDQPLYLCALRRELMPKFTWFHSKPHLFSPINLVYRYFFRDLNAVYVGRTIDAKARDFEHRRDRGKQSSIVFLFAKDNGIEIPSMEILSQGLTADESQYQEDLYVKKYRELGLNVLNTGATGIGTGSLGMKRKYSRKKIEETAKKYEYLNDFRRDQHAMFIAASKYGWMDALASLKRVIRPSRLFTKDVCIEIAKKCKSRKELADTDCSVYAKMLRKGWIDECNWLVSSHKGRKILTHSYCLKIARQYPTITAMHRERPTIVKKLYKTGWIEECTWLPRRVKHSNRIGSDKRGD